MASDDDASSVLQIEDESSNRVRKSTLGRFRSRLTLQIRLMTEYSDG